MSSLFERLTDFTNEMQKSELTKEINCISRMIVRYKKVLSADSKRDLLKWNSGLSSTEQQALVKRLITVEFIMFDYNAQLTRHEAMLQILLTTRDNQVKTFINTINTKK